MDPQSWLVLRTVAAAFFAILGLLIDVQSLFGGVAYMRKGRGSKPVLGWPLLSYLAAVLFCSAGLGLRVVAFALALVFHLLSTFGIRALPTHRSR